MGREMFLGSMKSGDSLEHVKDLLGLESPPEPTDIRQKNGSWYKLDKVGVAVFFDENLLFSGLVVDAPFFWPIEGIRIGMEQSMVLEYLGIPSRYWSVKDGVDRWLYDKTDERDFIRVDFSPENGKVKRIVR
jgi:hypothetical protein